jgi:hypothetical protein
MEILHVDWRVSRMFWIESKRNETKEREVKHVTCTQVTSDNFSRCHCLTAKGKKNSVHRWRRFLSLAMTNSRRNKNGIGNVCMVISSDRYHHICMCTTRVKQDLSSIMFVSLLLVHKYAIRTVEWLHRTCFKSTYFVIDRRPYLLQFLFLFPLFLIYSLVLCQSNIFIVKINHSLDIKHDVLVNSSLLLNSSCQLFRILDLFGITHVHVTWLILEQMVCVYHVLKLSSRTT